MTEQPAYDNFKSDSNPAGGPSVRARPEGKRNWRSESSGGPKFCGAFGCASCLFGAKRGGVR
eukprot:7400631-Alexandrium_andersonii.AAC.1